MARLKPRRPDGSEAMWVKTVRASIVIGLGVVAGVGHDMSDYGLAATFAGLLIAFLLMPQDSVRAAAFHGWYLGLGYFGWTLRWIVEPFLVDVARHGWMAPFALMFLAGGLALFWAVGFWAAQRLAVARSQIIVWMPVTLGLVELVRGHLFTGFPWGLLSYSAIGGPADVWFAWIGPYGATVLLVATVAATQTVLRRRGRWLWLPLVVVAALTVGLQALSPPAPSPTDQTVRLVQPNAPQHLKWDRDWMAVFFDRAIEQTRAGEPPDAVIWPETSIPSLLNYADPWIGQMAQAARGAPVVAGVQRRAGADYYNSAVVIDAPGTVSEMVDKSHLVPFGEYVPLSGWLRPLGLGTLVDQVAGFTSGTGSGVMDVGGLGQVRVLICYEGIFPEEIWQGGPRPELLLILTNDAWFGKNAGPRQHLVQAQARAIEQGLPVIRAANTGISAVIDARGRIVGSLPLDTVGHLDALVPARLPATVYARTGDWPLTLLLSLLIAGGAMRRRAIVVDHTRPRR